ncbi:MAG: type IV pilus assembly protein PilM [Pirellulales bacterium]
MARNTAVWGIDVGQCAVKAMRCRAGDDDSTIVVEAFDYIEYPKILSEPDADAAELVRDALKQLLSRNTLRGDRVAISVPGQSGLARFIKLPPVESKKIPDIVKYEARQQIPFALEDVVWDYQQMVGGSVEEGFALETEVGLFAMKRDQVYRALEPFVEAGIEVDIVQLTPLALYNFAVFDQMPDLPDAEDFDPDSPPESVVILSMGTDTTDLVVTNGFRVWQRSVPIGGNHFTRALTKELKLTFAKAEHLKRNAAQSQNAKALFQAMRPVFSDLLAEVQRSLSYFSNLDRNARIGRVVGVGNALKLPGLQRYLTQNLGMEVVKPASFDHLVGPEVVDAPAFKDNLLSFASCYGLAVQGVQTPRIKTNLLPEEIATERLIRGKKPWALAAAAALLMGLMINYWGHVSAYSTVDPEDFQSGTTGASQVSSDVQNFTSQFNSSIEQLKKHKEIGVTLVHNVEGRRKWLEVLKAINACMPSDPEDNAPEKLGDRNIVFIEKIDSQWDDKLKTWASRVDKYYVNMVPTEKKEGADPGADNGAAMPVAGPGGTKSGDEEDRPPLPDGAGWVFEIKGYHFHNQRDSDPQDRGYDYLARTVIKNLQQQRVKVKTPDGEEEIPVGELGIKFPVILDPKPIQWFDEMAATPGAAMMGGMGSMGMGPMGMGPMGGRGLYSKMGMGTGGATGQHPSNKILDSSGTMLDPEEQGTDGRYDFIIQFCWQEPEETEQPASGNQIAAAQQ